VEVEAEAAVEVEVEEASAEQRPSGKRPVPSLEIEE
jgi:hypothetical protein